MSGFKYNLIIVLGPTASGKTRFAAELATLVNGEIISADSRQIYRRMDVGTGKDYDDYIVNKTQITTHLIDIHEPGYKYNVFEFQRDFHKVYNQVIDLKKIPVLCGGTGLYIEAVTKQYRLISVPVNNELRQNLENKTLEELEEKLATYKKLHNKTDTDTKKRAIRAIEIEEYYLTHSDPEVQFPVINPIYIGIKYNRDLRRERITERLTQRIKTGMIEEVKSLLNEGITPENLIYYGLEYKYITNYLTGKLTYNEMFSQLNIAIHQFAKRQMTWFRKMEKEGCEIHWIEGTLPMDEKLEIALEILNFK